MNNNNCLAFFEKKCYDSFSFLSDEFNLKLLNSDEVENLESDLNNPFEDHIYNPFVSPPYWLLIRRINLDIKSISYWTHDKSSDIFVKLVSCADLKSISSDIEYYEFISLFFEDNGLFESSFLQNIYEDRIVRYPEFEPNISRFKKEKRYNYLVRCTNKYKSEFIYEIVLILTKTLEIEYEYRKLPSIYSLKNNPDLPPIKIWKESRTIPDRKYILDLKNLAIKLCNRLEANNIFNYTICPETSKINMSYILDDARNDYDGEDDYDNNNDWERDYFDYMTDGQLGSYDDFEGNIDDIDTWARG